MGEKSRLHGAALIVLSLSALAAAPALRQPSLGITPDDYLSQGRTFVTTHSFPDSYGGPVYVAIAGAFGWFEAGAPRSLILFQVLLSSWTVWLAFRLSKAFLSDDRAAAMGAMLYAVSPLRLVYQGYFLVETVYVTLVYAGLVLFVHVVRGNNRTMTTSAAAGLLLGGASLTRGNALLVVVGLTLVLLGYSRPNHARVSAFVLGFAAVVILWSWRNHLEYGHWKPTASGDYNVAALVVGPAKRATLGLPDVGNADVFKLPGENFASTFAEAPVLRTRALDFARLHVRPVLTSNLRGWCVALAGSGNAQWLTLWRTKIPALLGTGLRLACLALALVSLWLRRDVLAATTFAVVLLAHLIPAGAAGYSRFTLPVDPLTCALAGGAIAELSRKLAAARLRAHAHGRLA